MHCTSIEQQNPSNEMWMSTNYYLTEGVRPWWILFKIDHYSRAHRNRAVWSFMQEMDFPYSLFIFYIVFVLQCKTL